MRKIYQWPVDSPDKGPVMWKVFPSQMSWRHHAVWHIHWLWKMVSSSLYIFIYHLCLYTIVKIKMINTLQTVHVRTLTHWGSEKMTAILQTQRSRLCRPNSKIRMILLMEAKIWLTCLIIMFTVHPICVQDSIFKMSSPSESPETTLLNAFSWMKMYEFQLKFHSSLFLDVN